VGGATADQGCCWEPAGEECHKKEQLRRRRRSTGGVILCTCPGEFLPGVKRSDKWAE